MGAITKALTPIFEAEVAKEKAEWQPETCERCRFFNRDFLDCRINPPAIYTRVRPPQGTHNGINESSSGWPNVELRDWCGKFQRRND